MANQGLNGKLVAAVRVRGRVNVRYDITETLNRLHLKRVNNCTLVRATESYIGMLEKVQNHVAYGEISESVLEKLLAKKGEGLIAKEVFDQKYDMGKLKERLPFRLHPPRKGYKSTKLSVKQGGSLGYMGGKIDGLIARMV